MRWSILVISLAVGPWPSEAAAVDGYESCLALVATDPVKAEREAARWFRDGGGAPARHCRALALIDAGASSAGIDELLGLAAEEPMPVETRAEILVQAGDLLVEEGDLVTASVVAAQALALLPRDPEALALRAAIRAEQGDLPEALGDLDAAIGAANPSVRMLSLRSAVRRRLGDLVGARSDAEWATETDTKDAVAWLERGLVEAGLGDTTSARQSFLTAIALDRDGALGRAAQLSLQKMDAGID